MRYDNKLYIRLLDEIYRRAYHDKKVVNREEFGKKLGFANKTYISDLMNGTKKISNKILDKIEEAFGYDAAALIESYVNDTPKVVEPEEIYKNTSTKSPAEQIKDYARAIAAKVMGPDRVGDLLARDAEQVAEVLKLVEELAERMQPPATPAKDNKQSGTK